MGQIKYWIAIGVWLATTAKGSGQSLRELARQQGGQAPSIIVVDFPDTNLSQLSAESDLVLRGRVIGVKVRLSNDESMVVTEKVIAPLQVTKQRGLMTTASPGESQPIVVWTPGGHLIEDGLQLSTSFNALSNLMRSRS